MAITVQEDGKLFTIQTANTTYQMMADRYGVLLHLYYGRKAGGSMEYLLTYSDRGYCANINDAGRDRTYSLDFLPQEFPVSGTGDMRSPALIAEYGNGILMIAACVLIVLIYLFPTMAAFEAPVKTLIGNSIYFAFKRPLNIAVIIFIHTVPMAVTYTDLQRLPLYAFLWTFFGFAAVSLVSVNLLLKEYRPFLERGESGPENEERAEEDVYGKTETEILEEMQKLGM